jgi:hypothetical protein
MTISPKILSIIQKAGTAVFNADAALKEAVADSAKKVSDAMMKNPLSGQQDSLYLSWKNVARMSQAMSAIEVELKKLYAMAAAEPAHPTPALALAAPSAKASLEVLSAIDVTDVVAKRIPRKSKGAEKPSKFVAKKSVKGVRPRVKRTAEHDNTAKVLAHLQTVLNNQTFAKLNQSSIAIAIGLPKGSIGASVKKLINAGKLVQGQGKEFKLITAE